MESSNQLLCRITEASNAREEVKDGKGRWGGNGHEGIVNARLRLV
jgi:hypothetical protein